MIPTSLRRIARAARKNEIAWRYGYNLMPTIQQQFRRQHLSAEGRRVLQDMDANGIAVTSVDALLGESPCYAELMASVAELQERRSGDIVGARANASDDAIGKKTFLLEYLGRNPELDPASVYARFSLQPALLSIANAYLGMYGRLRYYNVWHTFATTSKARESQLWHRDREDLYIVKVFVYLNDVDLGAGPFTYARGTHRKGPIKSDPQYFLEGRVKRTDDDQMAAVVPRDRWLTATGARGTIIFADTNGYHRGGLAHESDRLMYTCMYTSQASESEEFFVRPAGMRATAADATSAFALR